MRRHIRNALLAAVAALGLLSGTVLGGGTHPPPVR